MTKHYCDRCNEEMFHTNKYKLVRVTADYVQSSEFNFGLLCDKCHKELRDIITLFNKKG